MPRQTRVSTGEKGDGVVDATLATSIRNGEDLSPFVRQAFEIGKPEALLQQLRYTVKKKEVEIEELCKLHYEEFIIAVDELRGVIVDSDELKITLACENIELQEVASSLLHKLEEFLECYSIKKNVGEALQILKICVRILNLCSKCNAHIAERQFHPALKILNLIEMDYLQNVPVKAIRKAIENQVPMIKSYTEKMVCSEFNNWLVHIRTAARQLGQLAIGQASCARRKDEELKARQREAEDQSRSGCGECVYTLDVESVDEDSFVKFDLTPVHRAYYIYYRLGIQDRFRSYYYENRMMQLNLDVQIALGQSFVESHQTLFAQIAGHFMVENRVLRTAGGLLSDSQVETMWEVATLKITTILENQFAQMHSPSHILLVKDNVILLAATLRKFGYKVTPLIEILDNCIDKYHNLLFSECKSQIAEALENDNYKQMIMRREYEYKQNVLSVNLQSIDMLMPVFPFVAPFSAFVPDVCRIVRSFISDSVSYLSYGGRMNLYEVAKKYLDKLLIEVLNNALLNKIHSGNLSVAQAMQMAANFNMLEHACDLFVQYSTQLCGIPIRFSEKPRAALTAKTILKASQVVAYNEVLNQVNVKADKFLTLTENINWIADEAPQNGNEYIQEVIIYLESMFSDAQQILCTEALYKIGSGVMQHISDTIVLAFLSDSVKRFTFSSVIGIDNDLRLLEQFADERFESTGLCDLKRECSLRDCLTEARQLINLLMSSQPENFMNPIIRERNYKSLDYKKVATICEKFKDSADTLFGSLGNRNAKQNARKKSMDTLKKRLKDLN